MKTAFFGLPAAALLFLGTMPQAFSAFVSSDVYANNDLTGDERVCKNRQFKNFLKCAHAEKGNASTWPDLSSCQSLLGDCRGWAYDGVNDGAITGNTEAYLGIAGISKNARYFGYYAYGNADPKKYVPFDCNYVSRLYKKITLSRAEAAFVFSQTNFAFGMPVPVGVVKYFYMVPFLRLSDDINYENCPILEGHFKKGSPIVRASKGGAVPTASIQPVGHAPSAQGEGVSPPPRRGNKT
ncbi:hypothetical protein NGA_0414800 [Nannochloropsis gaditana CCMP526]|uniref:uncharacterized protein n=1 Tax=Nannochloropsis gaditana (strain CCMP526) TaxID=1093141 RepID=UPI00029F6AD0|nr:hypothetical protein NGA_0414800 [Nannochloropsis gaditana CCMP526]EKU21549.1 hypothetical protein NGA_0414800 [Nannochloropsis gaditana CCMP526]|eukprot:XP_005854813.1 hypothetical protein NGA_0414800 [Nannochloropsis gaditana CCMP526]